MVGRCLVRDAGRQVGVDISVEAWDVGESEVGVRRGLELS